MRLLLVVFLITIGFCSMIYWADPNEKHIYIGPTMQTASGKYFCTFEDETVFQEYMQRGNVND